MSRKKKIQKHGYSFRNKVKLIRGGRDFFSLLNKLIEKAEKTIHLQFYIFLDDETGTTVMKSLKAATQRGVSVYLHLDGHASQALHKRCVIDMREAGVNVKWF